VAISIAIGALPTTFGTRKKFFSCGALATMLPPAPSVTMSGAPSFPLDDRGHRLDAGDINLVQLLDKAQNGVQLAGHALGILLAHRYAGEMRDSLHCLKINGHVFASEN
jgi:hypothetical protein